MRKFPCLDTAGAAAAAYRYSDSLPAGSRLLEDLLKGTEIHQLFESFYKLIKIPVSIIDLDANVLFSSRWQRICVQYHRTDPRTCARCYRVRHDARNSTQRRRAVRDLPLPERPD